MEKEAFISKLEMRTSRATAQRIADALGDALVEKLRHVKDGLSTSVFVVEGSHLAFKLSDMRLEKNQRVKHSRFKPHNFAEAMIKDESLQADIRLQLQPELTHEGVTRIHQEMLRYALWTQEGIEFWDHVPAASNPREIKNVMLDYRGVPYQIDEDGMRRFDDRYNEYPADGNGRRSDEQYLHMRANSWNEHGSPDAIDKPVFAQIKAGVASYEWPVQQAPLYTQRCNHETIRQFETAFNTLAPQKFAAIA